MATQIRTSRPKARSLWGHVARVYCRTCQVLFGKTLSLMAGEAEQEGRWYGRPCCAFINWLLRDADHCENELRGAKYEWLRT